VKSFARLRFWRVPAHAESRSLTRYRGIFLGGGFAGLSKFVSLVTVAISAPLTVAYLGAERYGMWMTISSLIALLAFADMGIGSGLVTALAATDGTRELDKRSRLVSSAFYMLFGLAAIISLVFLSAYSLIPWGEVFGVTTAHAAAEAGPGVLAFVLCFAAGLPFAVVQRVQMGLQESWRAYLWQTGASLVSLAGVLVAARQQAGVAWLVVAMNGGPVLVGAINSLVEFWIRMPTLRPRLSKCDPRVLKSLLGVGAIFVVLQLCGVAGTVADSFVIAQLFGAAAVAPYAVMYKLFQTSLIFSLFMVPLWPALGEALARGDYAWARAALNRAVLLSTVAGLLLAIVFLAFGQSIVRAWVGDQLVPDFLLVAGFAAWIVLSAYGGAMTSLLNNRQFLRLQVKIYGGASIAALALKVPFAYWMGPAGVVWATVIAYSLGYCVPAGLVARRMFRANISPAQSPQGSE
jgi:O-antigen/teichoic acid export membrane protein